MDEYEVSTSDMRQRIHRQETKNQQLESEQQEMMKKMSFLETLLSGSGSTTSISDSNGSVVEASLSKTS